MLFRSIALLSDDVIHSFWVPRLAGKTDMIPNRTNRLEVFVPNEIGVFFGQCAAFCGSAHSLMRFRVHVESLGDFHRWVTSLIPPPEPPAAGSADGRPVGGPATEAEEWPGSASHEQALEA